MDLQVLSKKKRERGFTLIETLIATAVFLVVVTAFYRAFTGVFAAVIASRADVLAAGLANEQFEIVRNLPYSAVGIQGGLPSGVIPHSQTISRGGMVFTIIATIREIDDPFDGKLGGTPSDTTPGDYKLVQFDLSCDQCRAFPALSFVSNVAPRGLETPSSSGALFVQAIDADGAPVPGANVHIVNTKVTPTITIDDTTNNDGLLQIVDAPPGENAYQITVTKPGFSTETTYAPGAAGNPNPLKPHSTVVVQQITQNSFAIDETGTAQVSTVTNSCTAVPNVSFSLAGAKLIGTSPSVLKYNQAFSTDATGARTVSGLEWDSYTATLSSNTYEMAGSIPLAPFALAPGATQNFQFVVQPKNPNAFLLTVKDAATGLSVTGAGATLSLGAFTNTLTTGQGFLSQSDWSGGSGQVTFSDPLRYFDSDGNIETNSPAGDLTLKKTGGLYASAGTLTSSTFDTGGPTNFYQINWLPQSQPTQAGTDPVRFQIATNNDNATWTFRGPDGTGSTYYTLANTNINVVHNGDRYLRYRLFLSTASTTYTPTVSGVAVAFNSLCVPPGQVIWDGLMSGTYTLSVAKTGYQTYSGTVNVSTPWQQQSITLQPQ